jgi:hypothetical protein
MSLILSISGGVFKKSATLPGNSLPDSPGNPKMAENKSCRRALVW